MKNKLFLSVLFMYICILLTSCNKDDDFTVTDNLIKTTWRCVYTSEYSEMEYAEFKFTSKTDVEIWSKEKDQGAVMTQKVTYEIKGYNINVKLDQGVISGIIDGNKMDFLIENDKLTFVKIYPPVHQDLLFKKTKSRAGST